jgi:nicotinamidase-related amidase
MSTTSSLLNSQCLAGDSLLVVADLQQVLGEAMPGKVLNRVLLNTNLLVRTAGLLNIPILHTEQNVSELGPTIPAIASALPASALLFGKMSFSCCRADGFLAALDRSGRRQVVIAGMEAHISVVQTALELTEGGLSVFVVEDAICSRRLENYHNALTRLQRSAVQVVSAESAVYEWLGSADHEHFKAVQSMLR